jgi:hypothetical protein
MIDIEELEKLNAERTQGPWEVVPHEWGGSTRIWAPQPAGAIIDFIGDNAEAVECNPAFIAYLANATPAIISQLKEREELLAWQAKVREDRTPWSQEARDAVIALEDRFENDEHGYSLVSMAHHAAHVDRADDAEAQVRELLKAVEKKDAALRHLEVYGCPVCAGDCASANPPVMCCPMQEIRAALGAQP